MFPIPVPDRTISVFSTPRPIRLAVILDADEPTAVADFHVVSHYLCHLWGGRYSAIIPSNRGTIDDPWFRLLDVLDPDCVYSVPVLTDQTLTRINRELAPAVLRHGVEQHSRNNGQLRFFGGIVRENPATITAIPHAIAAEPHLLSSPRFHYFTGPNDDEPYTRFIAQNFGTLSSTKDVALAFRGLRYRDTALDRTNAHAIFKILADGGFSAHTPERISSHFAHPPTTRMGMGVGQFTIVVGDSPLDLAVSRPIRGFQSYTSPPSSLWLPSCLGHDDEVVDLLRRYIATSFWGDPLKRCRIISASLEAGSLEELRLRLHRPAQLYASVEEVDPVTLGFPQPLDTFSVSHSSLESHLGFTVNLTRGRQVGIVNQSGVLDVQTPVFLRDLRPQDQMMVDLQIPFIRQDRVILQSTTEVWRLPRRQGIAHVFAPSSRVARITRLGLPSVAQPLLHSSSTKTCASSVEEARCETCPKSFGRAGPAQIWCSA